MIVAGLAPRYIGEHFWGEQKYIVAKTETSPRLHLFNFYAVDLWPNTYESPMHRVIAKGFKINDCDILGGGRVMKVSEKEMRIYARSSEYGGVHRKFLEFFQQDILREYRSKFGNLEIISIDVPPENDNDPRLDFLKEFTTENTGEK